MENQMAVNEEYRKRLWELHNPAKVSGQDTSSTALLSVLRSDFAGPREIFTVEEYRDPALRTTIIEEISHGEHGFFAVPIELVHFAKRVLGPGSALSLFAGFGEFLLGFQSGIGIEQNAGTAEWLRFFIEIAGHDSQIFIQDPGHWDSDKRFDRIVCNPPFGMRSVEADGIRRVVSLISENGKAVVFVPIKVLWHKQDEALRRFIAERVHVSAIISLPGRLWPNTGIQTAALVLDRKVSSKTYMGRSKAVADLTAIAEDYDAWSSGGHFSLGFETALELDRWDVAYYEPVDFDLGDLHSPHATVSLSEIANVSTSNPDGTATIAVNRTGSKAVWIDDESSLNERNNIFITTSARVNPAFLHLYLGSSVGRRAMARFIKGTSIPHISASDLARVPVILPELSMQAKIVNNALALRRTVSSLESLVEEGKQALTDKMFALSSVQAKFERFGSQTDKAFFQSLPFPIAVVYRKVVNAANNTQRFSLLIELFEVTIRFVALVNLADYVNGRRQESVIVDQVPACQRLQAPALGDWVNLFRSLVELKAAPETVPFLKEIKSFSLAKYRRTLQEFVEIRNASLRGHGATQSEEEYELKYQEHSPKVFDLVRSLGFLASYTLVKTGPMEKEGEFFKIAVQVLMGDNPHFEQSYITSRTPLDTNRVLYLNQDQESVVLDPYLVLEHCPECRRPEVLLLDKISDRKITYLSYEHGHKPAIENVNRLPLVLREAIRRN